MRRLHVSSLGLFPARRLRSGTGKLVVSRRLLVLALVTAVCATVGGFASHVVGGVPSEAAGDPVIGAAGDIACDPTNSHFNGGLGDGSSSCRQKYTSDLLVNQGLAGVIALGDNQYYCGGYQAFQQSYDLSWGRVKSITRPAVGNHEYLTAGGTGCTPANQGAAGYFQYFGAAAGLPGQGYYSYDIGTWHLIALNTNCGDAGGCGATSAQGRWLQADLAAHTNYCTLAYWHIPRFSSGGRANANSQSFWNQLYAADADVILAAHDHLYERFAPQSPSGVADPVRGIREFIVGTGGANTTSFAATAANSEVRNDNTAGVLKLTLHATSYDWQFVPEAGKTFTDSGTTPCHGAATTPTATATSTTTPVAGATLTATRTTTATPTTTLTPAGTLTPTATPVPGSTLALGAVADAYVSDGVTTNNGTSTTLRVDGSPLVRSYLRFNVQGITGGVSSASLRVFGNSSQSVGYEVHSVADTSWGETAITFVNAPPFATLSTGSSGPVSAGTWTTVDVTSLITGNGLVSLALITPNTTALSLASRESGANAPQLIIVTTAAPGG